jgi:dUTP diphosphatase
LPLYQDNSVFLQVMRDAQLKDKEMLKVKINNRGRQPLPTYATALSAGMDLRANIEEDITLLPLQRQLVPTGLHIALPEGYEAQIRPRSGLALKHGITVLNTPGTVDADYRGEIMVLLVNFSNEPFTVKDGERIAQMVIAKHEKVDFELVDTLDETERGAGGYGHTGLK